MTEKTDPSVVTFLLAGCPRCGTTWVHAALKNHPEVYLPPQKQTYFFDGNFDKGLEWYLSNYDGVQDQHVAVGEIATGYSQSHAVPRMAETFPQVKIMLAMRNPSERAYSFFQSRAVTQGWKTIHDAIADEPAMLTQGHYIEQIDHLREYYPDERILLLFYEDLRENDSAYLRSILEYIGVDTSYQSPEIGRMVQVAAFPKTRKFLRKAKLGPLVDAVSGTAIGDLLRKQIKARGIRRYPPMDAATQKFLSDHYRPYNERLSVYCQRDLSGWNA